MYQNYDLNTYSIYKKKFIYYKNKLDKTYKKLKKAYNNENTDKINKLLPKLKYYLIIVNQYNI